MTEHLKRTRLFFVSYAPLWLMLTLRALPDGDLREREVELGGRQRAGHLSGDCDTRRSGAAGPAKRAADSRPAARWGRASVVSH